MTVRKTTISGAVHFAQDRLGVATLDAKTFLSGVIFPLARPADTVRIDKGQLFLEFRTMMQVVKLGNTLRIAARYGVGCNVINLLVSYPNDTTVVQAIQIFFSRTNPCYFPA